MEEVDQGLHSYKVFVGIVSQIFTTIHFEAVFKAQQLYLIYAQSRMLYKILPYASR
jgi:hypothetical protein